MKWWAHGYMSPLFHGIVDLSARETANKGKTVNVRRYQGSIAQAYDGTVIVEKLCFCGICKKSESIKLEIVVRMRGQKYTLRHVNPSSIVNRHI